MNQIIKPILEAEARKVLGLNFDLDGLVVQLNRMVTKEKFEKYDYTLELYMKAKYDKDMYLRDLVRKYITDEEISIFNNEDVNIRVNGLNNTLIVSDSGCASCGI